MWPQDGSQGRLRGRRVYSVPNGEPPGAPCDVNNDDVYSRPPYRPSSEFAAPPTPYCQDFSFDTTAATTNSPAYGNPNETYYPEHFGMENQRYHHRSPNHQEYQDEDCAPHRPKSPRRSKLGYQEGSDKESDDEQPPNNSKNLVHHPACPGPTDEELGFFGKLLKRFTNPTSYHSKQDNQQTAVVPFRGSKHRQNFGVLNDLWNPNNMSRWRKVQDWDQQKEIQWNQLIRCKMEGQHVSCGIEQMAMDALKAYYSPGGECVSHRMFYGLLKRNEDVPLNIFMYRLTDTEFLRMISSLNRLFHEDREVAKKAHLDHPPPTHIEKIMMKETLSVIDPSSRTSVIARKLWDLLLDWYAMKISQCLAPQINANF